VISVAALQEPPDGVQVPREIGIQLQPLETDEAVDILKNDKWKGDTAPGKIGVALYAASKQCPYRLIASVDVAVDDVVTWL